MKCGKNGDCPQKAKSLSLPRPGKELRLSKEDKLILERKKNAITLRPIVKLSKLRGMDKIERATSYWSGLKVETLYLNG